VIAASRTGIGAIAGVPNLLGRRFPDNKLPLNSTSRKP